MRPESYKPAPSTWVSAKRALAFAKPRIRTIDQVNEIADLLLQQSVFEGIEKDDLLAVAFFMEAKHCEAGECILSKGQPLEHWCLMLDGTAFMTRYSAQRGGEQSASTLGPNDTWSEAALLHSTHPRRSSITVIAGQQGCITLRLRYTDFDAINDPRQALQMLPPEGILGPLTIPELSPAQRRAASLTMLCCCLRRLAAAKPPDERTPEEASEMEPFLSNLPAYRAYPAELIACLAAACRPMTLPPGGIVYEVSTLADAQVTVLRGEVQLRKFGAAGEDGDGDVATGAGAGLGVAGVVAAAAAAASLSLPASSGGSVVAPSSPATQQSGGEAADASGARLSIRARLRREREARKQMQRQLDEYVARMDSSEPSAPRKSEAASSSGPVDWTRVFMQKAMRIAEPVWKALHPADDTRRQQQAGTDTGADSKLDEEPITEVAQLLGPAAAKAYYRGLQTQGYSDNEAPSAGGGGPSRSGEGTPGARDGGDEASATRERWRRWMFSVDGPETEKQRTLRNMAMRASRIYRSSNARSRRSNFDSDEMDEMYGPLVATLTRGSPVGELSTFTLHSTMRKESAVAGPSGCEVLLMDWEAFQQGVLAARVAVLSRAAGFLGSLPRARLKQLAELCLCLSVDAGTLLARQGAVLENMVVVQTGELQLLHEPSAALHARITTIKCHAANRSRNGRSHAVPLLATLASTHLPGAGKAGAAGGGAAGAATGAGTVRPGPPPSPPSFSGTSTAAAEVTLQGLPIGEMAAGAILGENILGFTPPHSNGPGPHALHGAASAPHLHADPTLAAKRAGAASEGAASAPVSAHGPGQGHGHPLGAGGAGSGGSAADGHHPPAGLPGAEGPKWPATVLAARASVLLVIPKSMLYMAEFDGLRPQLQRYAAERKVWLAKRVEGAYREAAAPPTMPAVFANATAAAAAAAAGGVAASDGSAPGSPTSAGGAGGPGASGLQQAPSVPSLRRSVLSNTAAAAAAGGAPGAGAEPPRRAGSGDMNVGVSSDPDGGNSRGATPPRGFGITRRRSVESFPTSSSPSTSSHNGPIGALAGTTGGGGGGVTISGGSTTGPSGGSGGPRLTSKWDFLDAPTASSLGAEASNPWMAPPVFATGSFSRSALGPPPSLLDTGGGAGAYGGGSFTTAASPYGSMPLRRPSSGAMRSYRDAANAAASAAAAAAGSGGSGGAETSGLSLVQQALLEVGFDPALATDASAADVTSVRRSSGMASLPSLAPSNGIPTGPGSAAPFAPPPRLTVNPNARASFSGGPSPPASLDFDPLRLSSPSTTPFRSPNALTPTPRRSYSGTPGALVPLNSAPPMSLLDSAPTGLSITAGRAPSPSSAAMTPHAQTQPYAPAAPPPLPGRLSAHKRSSYCGFPTSTAARRSDFDGGGAAGVVPASPRNPSQVGPPPPLLQPRVPGLAAVDMLEAVAAVAGGPPSSPGLYTRNARSSYTGGGIASAPRVSSMESLWMPGDGPRRPVGRGGGGGSGARGHAVSLSYDSTTVMDPGEAEEEVALARSLVPRNQAGNFMVREGLSSTPVKQSAVRRIANCF